jgi:hypothetical protein
VILILDCGVGNFLSITRIITIVGGKCYFGHSQADIDKAKKLLFQELEVLIMELKLSVFFRFKKC